MIKHYDKKISRSIYYFKEKAILNGIDMILCYLPLG